MPTLALKDYRIKANDIAPFDSTVMYLPEGMTISEMVREIELWCMAQEAGRSRLLIYCHGSPGWLQLCKEGLKLANLELLAPLQPYFDEVDIHACLVARGDAGRAFCHKLAKVLECPVLGAVELQRNTGRATDGGFVDDKLYEGKYYVHSTTGARHGPYTDPKSR